MKTNLKKIRTLFQNNKKILIGGSTLCLIFWNAEVVAGTLETQLDNINTLAQGKLLKVGLGIGTVIGAITAIVKGSIGLAASIIGIAILLSYFLGWIQSEGFVQGIKA